jgi:predicted transcriptional regulator
MSIRVLAKLLLQHYKNVYDDAKLLEQIGLIKKTKEGIFSVPWDEVTAKSVLKKPRHWQTGWLGTS